MIDPTGKGGEAVLNGDNIAINVKFVFYGSQTTSANADTKKERQKAITDRITNIQTSLNGSKFTMEGPDGVKSSRGDTKFDLSFNFQVEFLDEYDAYNKMKENIGDKFDATLVFVRLEDDLKEGILPASVSTEAALYKNKLSYGEDTKTGDNSMNLQISQFNNTTFLHELFAHILGSRSNDKEAHINEVAAGTKEFSIRTQKFAKGVDPKYQVEQLDQGTGEMVNVLKEDLRKVIQADIDLIKPFGDWEKQSDGKWKAWLSGATNTFFSINKDVERVLKSGVNYYERRQFNVHDKKNTTEKVFSLY